MAGGCVAKTRREHDKREASLPDVETDPPHQTLTHDKCHGEIRRDFTSDKLLPGLYSDAKGYVVKRRIPHEKFSSGTRAETGASRRYRFPGAAAFHS